jgi:hypothetical protein
MAGKRETPSEDEIYKKLDSLEARFKSLEADIRADLLGLEGRILSVTSGEYHGNRNRPENIWRFEGTPPGYDHDKYGIFTDKDYGL